MSVTVVDYGAGNLASVMRAFQRAGADATVANDARDVGAATHLLVPGVGSFQTAMSNLRAGGWDEAILAHAARERPLLGICLGMQLLGSVGDEGGATPGLGLISGRTLHLRRLGCELKTPHVGWNDVSVTADSDLLTGIPDRTDYYFAHSYALVPESADDVLGRTEHGCVFTSIVQRGPVYGLQFHPEKSSAAGLRVLGNFATC